MTNKIRFITVLFTFATFALAVTANGQTTLTGNANGPGGSPDKWNNAANWDFSIPSGTDSAILAAGLDRGAHNATTPTYSGGLTLMNNSTLQIGWNSNIPQSFNALGTGSITMNEGSSIWIRYNAASAMSNPITLAGNATIDVSPSTQGHHDTRDFNGAISGPGVLTHSGNNNGLTNFNVANTFSGLVLDARDRHRVAANAAGSLGLGDVTVNPRANADNRSAVLIINAMDAIDDFATLNLNGAGYAGTSPFGTTLLEMNADDTIGAFFVGGLDQGIGMFDSSTHAGLIGGNGTLTVTGITSAAVPEPASIAIWSLIGLGLAGFGVYCARRKK